MPTKLKLVRITAKTAKEYGERVAELEKIATYPLGGDFFKIEHGTDYFAFFRRLGDMHYYAVIDRENDRIAAVAAGILRSRPLRAWYLCDLKVHPDYRGQNITIWMLKRAFFQNYIKCSRGYAISMNTSIDSPNRVAKLLARFPWIPIRQSGRLFFFELSADQMRKTSALIIKYRGPISFLSLRGIKDIVLQSSAQPIPLMHIQFGPCAEKGLKEPNEGSVHMFCVPETDTVFLQALAEEGLIPSSSAAIIQHRMSDRKWDFVLTSDI